MIDQVMGKIAFEFWKNDPLIQSAIRLISTNYTCKYSELRYTFVCNSNCILFGDCDNKDWDIPHVIQRRMMKRMLCSKKQLEQFLFEVLL